MQVFLIRVTDLNLPVLVLVIRLVNLGIEKQPSVCRSLETVRKLDLNLICSLFLRGRPIRINIRPNITSMLMLLDVILHLMIYLLILKISSVL